MFEVKEMSATELKFIKAYVDALRRDHSLLSTVIELMKPEKLAVTSVVQAARLSKVMQEMHAEFELTINALPSTAKFFRRKNTVKYPTLNELSDLFSLSFFKVITTVEGGPTAPSKHAGGWFSGDPYSWQSVFDNLQKNPPFNALVTDCLKALAKMFPAMKDLYFGEGPKHDAPLNFWPSKQLDYNDDDDDEWYDQNEKKN
jgi:hypothetical protein